jgi:SAM-dependent methyltransferase
MVSFWDERYSSSDYVYGESPNAFFAEEISNHKVGKILLPCDGEGRNAVYAALKGWEVFAFDISEEGKKKAMLLADKNKVTIDFELADASMIQYTSDTMDIVSLIYAHLPGNIRKPLHSNCIKWLKPGGKIILEAFNPLQLQNQSGGPRDISMLYTVEMLEEDFKCMRIDKLEYANIRLQEGLFHEGVADVIRMVATKK